MIEIPRYVHRDGDSMLVDTLEELQIAESEGWRVNPNEPDVCWTDQPEPGVPVTIDVTAIYVGDGRTGDVTDELADMAESTEPSGPVKRGPGRPRKNW